MNDDWIAVASLDDVPVGQMLAVVVAGDALCLYNLNGSIYATQNICTHEEASLAEGYLEGDCVECPLHQALFHIPTGKATTPPATVDLRVYPVKVEGGTIRVCAQKSGD
jgi:nitrite reductase/ring-hydroxylating ferredoxin subunit